MSKTPPIPESAARSQPEAEIDAAHAVVGASEAQQAGAVVIGRRGLRLRERHFLLLVLLLAFCLRMVAIGIFTGLNAPPKRGTDEYEYDVYAWNVAQGRGYRGPSADVQDRDHLTAYRAPFPSLCWAGVYRLCGHRYAAAYAFDSLLGALTALLLYGITRNCFDRRAARLAAFLYAVYPLAIFFNLTLLTETLASFLVCLFAWCCLHLKDTRGRAWAVGAGTGLGLLILSKPGYVAMLPFLGLWAVLVCGRSPELWKRAGIIPLMAGLLLLPWIVRNALVMHAFIPLSTGGGSMLLQANNRIVVSDPRYYGYAIWDTDLPEYAPQLRAANDEIKRDALARQFAVRWLRANPDKWFYLLRGKLLRLWTPQYYGLKSSRWGLLACAFYGLILALFLAAFLPITRRFLKERHPGLILHALIAATVLTGLLFQSMHRYRFPIDSLCIAMAAAALVWAYDVVSAGSYPQVFADLRAFARSHRKALAGGVVFAVGVVLASRLDLYHIERCRDRECRDRLQAIGGAVTAYRATYGRIPSRLEDLIPRFLRNAEALHCPKASLSYADYMLLGSPDPRSARRLCSYRLVPPAGRAETALIVESGARHFGNANRIEEDGTVVGSSLASPPTRSADP